MGQVVKVIKFASKECIKGVTMDSKTIDAGEIIRAYHFAHGRFILPEDVPIKVRIVAHFRVPKLFPLEKRDRVIDKREPCFDGPTACEIASKVLDALNGIAWPSQQQIACLIVRKYWTLEADRLELYITTDADELKKERG